MRNKNNGLIHLTVLVFMLLLVLPRLETVQAAEEKFPTRPIELVVATPPGGGVDILARILAEGTGPFLGQKLAVINIPGAASTIGTYNIAKAKPDGYVLGVLQNAPLTMAPHLIKVPYTIGDFTYIIQITEAPYIFCVRAESPIQNAKDLFEYARQNPRKLIYATAGIGSAPHFAGESIFQAMDVKVRSIPYGGAGDSVKALLGGQVDLYSGTIPPVLPHIKSGTVRPIFITAQKSIEELPGVPGVGDLRHPECTTLSRRGIVGPKGLSPDRISILENAFRQAIQIDKVNKTITGTGENVVPLLGKQFEEQVRAEAAAMAIVAKKLGLTPK